jgi:hypothetical protein
MTRGGAAALAATVLCGLAWVPPGAAGAAPVVQAAHASTANRVTDTVLLNERYDYRRENWRISEASGLPRWLELRQGRLTGTAPRLGRWTVRLDERGTGRRSGEDRSTVLVVKAIRPRVVPGTLLLSQGFDGRPANAESSAAIVSGDGRTVVFSSRASNLVPGTDAIAGRLYVWDLATRQVSLLHRELWATVQGISRDGQRVLVRLSAGLILIDRADGSATQVAPRAAGAALTGDGERVLYQDAAGSGSNRLLEWSRVTGATRTIVPDLVSRALVGASADGRLALLSAGSSSELLDTTTGEVRDVGRLGVEGGYPGRATVSDDGRLLAVHGAGPAAGHGHGGDPIDVVHDSALGEPRGPQHNPAAAITADGSRYAVATATRHLRIVDVATGVRTSPFLAPPSGQETWASLSDDASRVAYVSDGHDLLHGTRRGVANVFLWVRPR